MTVWVALLELAAASPLVIDAGQVFDGNTFLGPRRVVVEDGRILALLDPDAALPTDAALLDAPDATLAPGLVDGHLHLWSVPIDRLTDVERYSWGRIAEEYMSRMRTNRLDLLTHGVTAVLDLGTMRNGVARFRSALTHGALGGPAWFTSGPLFTAPGGHPVGTIYAGNHDLADQAVILLDGTPDEARAEVAALARDGMDVVKVVYDGGGSLGYAGPPRALPVPELALIVAVVEEAHAHGLPVYAHVTSEAEAQAMVDAGVDGLEHAFPVAEDSPLFAAMATRGTFWTPTLGIFDDDFRFDHPPFDVLLDAVRRAHAAGVPIAAGTDYPTSGGLPGDDLYREIHWLEAAGLDRTTALSAATLRAASKIPGYPGGRIAVGTPADLVLFDGDLATEAPSADRVRQVWQGGRPVLGPDDALLPDRVPGFRTSNFIPSVYAFYDPVVGGVVGVNLLHVDLANTGVAANLNVMGSFLPTFDATLDLSFPSPIPRTALGLTAHFDNDEKLSFGVVGVNETDDPLRYASTVVQVGATGVTRLGAGWSTTTSLALNRYALTAVDGGLPAVEGANGGLTPVAGLALAHDGRDSATEPWHGHYASIGADGSTVGFARTTAELRGYGRLADWQTVAGRVRVQQAFGATPFWSLPEFGGAEVGRGFVVDRYLGDLAVVGQAELRSRIYKALHGAAFVDVGWVAGGWSELRPANVHPAVGLGPRVRINGEAILAWDVGFGLGPTGVESFSVGFHNGHTF